MFKVSFEPVNDDKLVQISIDGDGMTLAIVDVYTDDAHMLVRLTPGEAEYLASAMGIYAMKLQESRTVRGLQGAPGGYGPQ